MTLPLPVLDYETFGPHLGKLMIGGQQARARGQATRAFPLFLSMPCPTPPPYLRAHLSPLAEEETPDREPEAKAYWGGGFSTEEIEHLKRETRIAVYLSNDLIRYAWRLVEISWERAGGFESGLELPNSSRAASAGAIAVAFASLEAAINEGVENLAGMLTHLGHDARARQVFLSRTLSLRDRLDALGAAHGHAIDWGGQAAFQAFDLLVAVRNHLLHHEMKDASVATGYWPANRLRALPNLISSPYRRRTDLHWHDHVLSPSGAAWAVGTACAVLETLDNWWADSSTVAEYRRREVSEGRGPILTGDL